MKTTDGQEITDQLLCERFPHLFADRHMDMRTTALCWGFEIGPGWMGIIYEAAEKLEKLILKYIYDYPEEENPFPWFTMNSWYGIKWSICHPLRAIRCFGEWMDVAIGLRDANPWWPRASQIKEKYGTLRFYLTCGTLEMYDITDKAESQSKKICEECGETGKMRGQEWCYTRCTPCWKRMDK